MKTIWVGIVGVFLMAPLAASRADDMPEKDDLVVMRIPELTQLAGPGDQLPKEIELQSFSFGLAPEVVTSTSAKKDEVLNAPLEFQDFSVLIDADAWTPVLMKLAKDRTHLKQVIVDIRHPHMSMHYELNDVVVTNIEISGTARTGEDISDQVGFAYKSVKLVSTRDHFKSTATLMN